MSASRGLVPRAARIAFVVTVLLACNAWSQDLPGGSEAAARMETEATVRQYCGTCHSATAATAGVVLDASALAEAGRRAETFEKVLRQLRGGTMPPPGQPRPEPEVYRRVSDYLAGELEAYATANPNPGPAPFAHRLTRTEYRNAVRDLLALPDLPKEMDYALMLPADNVSSGFDNLADTLFVSPFALERYMNAARRISRVAVGDPELGPLVNVFTTSVREPQEDRNPALPFGTRGGVRLDTYFPLDGEYAFEVEVSDARAEPHQLEVTIDDERVALIAVEGGRRSSPSAQPLRLAVAAGSRSVGVTFLERSQALSETPLRPPGRIRGELPSVAKVTITGPYGVTGSGDTPSRRRIFGCQPAAAGDEMPCAEQILSDLIRRAYRHPASESDLERLLPFFEAGYSRGGFETGIQHALERLLVSPPGLRQSPVNKTNQRGDSWHWLF